MTTDTTTAMRMALDDIEAAIKHFTRTPSALKDSEARGKAHAAIAALREAIERDGWLPIETAPKDGSSFIGYGKVYQPRGWSGWRDDLDKDHPTAYGWHVLQCSYSYGNWQTGKIAGFSPTHWRPLPPAPKD